MLNWWLHGCMCLDSLHYMSSLIRVRGVCFNDKIKSEMHLNICSRRKKQTTMSRHNNIGKIGAKLMESQNTLQSTHVLKLNVF